MALKWTKGHDQYYHGYNKKEALNFAGYFGDDTLVGTNYLYNLDQTSAREQMDFQNFMSSTAHQREVKDLIAAGINPVLSANQGADSGAGASASADAAAVSAKMQQKMQESLQKKQLKNERLLNKRNNDMSWKISQEQLKAQKYMNKYSTDKSYQLGIYQAGTGLQSALASASAARFAASMNYLASQYAADTSLLNAREQRAFDNAHPNNIWNAGGSLLSGLGLGLGSGSYGDSNYNSKSKGNKKAGKGRN